MIDLILKIAEYELYCDKEYIEENVETYKNKTYKELFSGNNFKEFFGIKYFNGEMLIQDAIVRYIAVEKENETIVIRDS